jgi:hypothetical protein
LSIEEGERRRGMSLIVERFLICDGDCSPDNLEKNFGVDDRVNWRNAFELRRLSRVSGWTSSGTYDFCPKCSKKRKSKEKSE